MIHLEDDIKLAIKEMLNDNSYDVEFDVNLYTYSKSPDFMREIEDTKSYDIEKRKYIPTMIEEIEGNYEDVPQLDMINPAILISFMIPTSETTIDYEYIRTQPNFRAFMSALEEVRRNNTTKVINLGDKGYWLKYNSQLTVKDDGADVEMLGFSIKALDNIEEMSFISGNNFQVDKLENTIRFTMNGEIRNFAYNVNEYLDFKLTKENGDIIIEYRDYEGNLKGTRQISNGVLPDEYELKRFQGYYYFLGISEETNGYQSVLIEDFSTLENQVSSSWEITKHDEENYGAIAFGHNGDLTLTFSTPKPASQAFQQGVEGITHMLFDYYLDATYTKDTFLGNHYKYYLDDVEIFPISKNHGFSGETDADQTIMGNTTKSLINENIQANTFSMYHKNHRKVNEIMKNYLSKDVEQNKTWELKIEYPTHFENYTVIIRSIGGQSDYNVPSLLSFEVEIEG